MFVLLSQSFREKYDYAKVLDWISIVGLSFSILGLVVTIVYHLEIKSVFQTTSGLMIKIPAQAGWCFYLLESLFPQLFQLLRRL